MCNRCILENGYNLFLRGADRVKCGCPFDVPCEQNYFKMVMDAQDLGLLSGYVESNFYTLSRIEESLTKKAITATGNRFFGIYKLNLSGLNTFLFKTQRSSSQ